MVFLGNFIGASFVAFMVVYAGIPELYGGVLGEKMVAAALFRVNQTFGEAFARGVLCNILVCIAVWAAFAAKEGYREASDELLAGHALCVVAALNTALRTFILEYPDF